VRILPGIKMDAVDGVMTRGPDHRDSEALGKSGLVLDRASLKSDPAAILGVLESACRERTPSGMVVAVTEPVIR
jgi:hypothetical protein